MKAVIDKLSLYREVSEDLAELQKSLFEESWKGLLKDLKSACPSTLNQQDCAKLASTWENVSIVNEDKTNRDASSANVLIYKRAQSEDRWAEKFTDTALRPLQGSSSYEKLKPVAQDMDSKVFQGYPVGKLFNLQRSPFKSRAHRGDCPRSAKSLCPVLRLQGNIIWISFSILPIAFRRLLQFS